MPKRKPSESGSRAAIVVAIIAAVGGWGTAAITNWDKFGGAGNHVSGSPYVKWTAKWKNVDWKTCASKSLEALQLADPAEQISNYDEYPTENSSGAAGVSHIAGFRSVTGWVSCISQDSGTLVYVAAAGGVESEAQAKLQQLEQLLWPRLAAKPQ